MCNVFFNIPCGAKFLREFIFADLAIFCVLRELSFAIRTDWFFLLGINFCDVQKVPSIENIFVFIFSMCNRNTYFKTISQYFALSYKH